jgi:multidrug resistance efflux pump
VANFTKQDWQNMQTALAAALARAEAAEAQVADLGAQVANADAFAKENDDLRKRISDANAVIQKQSEYAEKMRADMEAAKAELSKAQADAKTIGELRENNAALLGRLSLAHQNNQKLLEKPRKKNDVDGRIRRLKRRIKALEAKEPKARRGSNADQV